MCHHENVPFYVPQCTFTHKAGGRYNDSNNQVFEKGSGIIMNAKKYLQNLRRLDIVIDQKIKELDGLKAMTACIGSFDYSRERVITSPSGEAPFEKNVDRIIELEVEIRDEIDKFVDEKHKIINQIQSLRDADEIKVLYMRYIECQTFEKIAVDMDYTIRNIYFIHGRALQNFEKI